MSEQIPAAVVRTRAQRRWRISLIWTIPFVTVLVAAWLAWDTLSKRGPEITIQFDTASGLQANQSHIRNRDVDLGIIEKVDLSPNLDHVIVTARMSREAWPLLTDKTLFWVVRPRFFAGSVSGLETIISGAYIQLEPDAEGGKTETHFIGLEDPPVLRTSVPGHTFRLKSPRIGSLNPGSPVMFRDLTVGEVLGWDVGELAKEVTIEAFVRAPYDRYVHDKSVFWNASGASVQLGANGLKLELESLRALVLGGVAFDTPDKSAQSAQSEQDHEFTLYSDRQAAETAEYDRSLLFVSYFNGSVAGLGVGSPVTLHGMQIGAVTDVTLDYNDAEDKVQAVVRYQIEPDHIVGFKLPENQELDTKMADLVRKGLRIRLESANIITGSKQIALDVYTDAPPAAFAKKDDTYVLAPLDDGKTDIATAANDLITQLRKIPFEQIGQNLNQTLAGANATVNDPNLKQALASLNETLNSTRTLMVSLNKGADPLLQRLPKIAADLEETVKHANQLVSSLDDSHAPGSQFGRDTARLFSQLSDAARSVRILADLLSRHPEALIRGRSEQEVQ